MDLVKQGWRDANAACPAMWRFPILRFDRWLKRPSRRVIRNLVPLSVESRVLEEGAGGGALGLAVAVKSGAHVYALDVATEALRSCRANADAVRERYTVSHFSVIQGDAFRLPFRDSAFDLIMSEGLVEHFGNADARRGLFSEARRCLKPEGFLFVLIPNNEHPLTDWWRDRGYPWLDRLSPIREYATGPRQLASDFEGNGFEVLCQDCEHAWSTLAKFPNWLVLRGLAFVLNRCVPLPRALRLIFGVGTYVLGRRLSAPR